MSPPVPAWALSGMGLCLGQHWRNVFTERQGDSRDLFSSLWAGGGQRQERNARWAGLRPGVVQATCGVWGPGNTASRKLSWFLWKLWRREGTHRLGRFILCAACRVCCDLSLLRIDCLTSMAPGSSPTPELMPWLLGPNDGFYLSPLLGILFPHPSWSLAFGSNLAAP